MLLILSACLWVGWLAAKIGPDTIVGRACQEWFIDRPAAWTASLTLRKAVSLIVAGAVVAVAVAYLAPIISGEAALLLAGDALAYVELLSAVVIVAIRGGRASALVRLKAGAVTSHVLACFRIGPSTREHRPPRRRSRPSPPSDPGEPAFALA